MNELAQAKGANAAGLRVLAESYGIPLERIDRLYLAGGFARHIDVDAARRIGLVPDLPRRTHRQGRQRRARWARRWRCSHARAAPSSKRS